jgi:ATP-binding cassette subfamily B protein
VLKRFVSYFKPYKLLFWLDLVAAFLVAGIDLLYPLLTKSMLNDYIKNKAVSTVLIIAGVLLILYVIKMGLNYFMGYYGHVMSAKMQRDMRRDLFAHLETLPVSFFDKSKTGVLISRSTGDLQDVSELAHHGPEDLFTSIVLLVGSSIIMAMMNWFLTLILILCLPPMVWL